MFSQLFSKYVHKIHHKQKMWFQLFCNYRIFFWCGGIVSQMLQSFFHKMNIFCSRVLFELVFLFDPFWFDCLVADFSMIKYHIVFYFSRSHNCCKPLQVIAKSLKVIQLDACSESLQRLFGTVGSLFFAFSPSSSQGTLVKWIIFFCNFLG